MTWLSYVLLLIGASWALVGVFRLYALSRMMIDTPNERSSHCAPTPRGGGIVFFILWFVLLGVFYYFGYLKKELLYYFSPVAALGMLGFVEDKRGVSKGIRFGIQLLVAVAGLFMLAEGGDLLQSRLPWFVPLPLCFLIMTVAIVWFINLFNFMDGADGLAASEGIYVMLLSGGLLYHQQQYELAMIAWGLASLLTGFFIWNSPVARIFMGDSGSYFLGGVIAFFAFYTHAHNLIQIEVWLIATAFFWFDATITLLRRIAANEKWSEPHRKHAYQRLLQRGWGHGKLLLVVMVINLILAAMAIFAYQHPALMTMSLTASVVFLTCLYVFLEIYKPMFVAFYESSYLKK